MRTDQALALVGGILGVAIVPVVLASVLFGTDGDSMQEEEVGAAMVGTVHIVSIVVFALASISAIVVAFTVKTPRISGYVLVGLGIAMIAISNVAGAISWVPMLVGGIVGIRYGDKPGL